MSASVGAVAVANPEHLLQDLTDRRERVELALLHVLEQAAQLRVLLNLRLQMPPRARRGDAEDLGREVPSPARLELALRLEPRAMLLDLLPELGDPLAPDRLGEHDGRTPSAARRQREHLPHLGQHRLRHRMIHLVDRDHVGDLHDSRLQRLDRVPRAGHQREHDRVGDRDHADLALPGADRLQEHEVLPRSVEDEQRLQRRLGEAAEERPLRERARRVDRDHPDVRAAGAHDADQRGDEARLADAGRPREADGVRAPRLRVQIAHDLVGERIAVLDERDRARERAPVTRAERVDEALARPVAAAAHAPAPSPASVGAGSTPRASPRTVTALPAVNAAAIPYVQRAPTLAVSAPDATIARPSSALWMLMMTVNARPRTRSDVWRWTIRTVIGKARPLPKPVTTMASAAIHTSGATAAPKMPAASGTNANT